MVNSNVSYLFRGKFFKCAENKGQIVNKQTGEVTEYYTVMLTNGVKTFHVTCGVEADLITKCELFEPYHMFVDIVDNKGVQKLKVVAIQPLDGKPPVK